MRLFMLLVGVVATSLLIATPSSADIFELKSGHKISGRLISEKKVKGKTFLIIKTDSGATLKLEKVKFIKRHFASDEVSNEYKSRVGSMEDTADAHWNVYNWCKEQGTARFRDEMDHHLMQIVRLDPRDKKARNLLGFREYGGIWVNENKMLADRGYVKKSGKWVSELQSSVNETKLKVETEVNARKSALTRWRRNTLGKKSVTQAKNELFDLVNEQLVPIIAGKNYLGKAKNNPQHRILYLEAIGRIPTRQAQNVLIKYALIDEVPDVRDRAALLLMNPEVYNVADAVGPISGNLKNENNAVILRAASLLEQINSTRAILPLIGSLVTKHKVATGNQAGRTTVGQGTGGSGLDTGNKPTHRIETAYNEEVAQALRSITKQNGFGFDAESWKAWYVENHTITRYDFRRDE